MNKAFLFDMDGVLIDSENEWLRLETADGANLYGPTIAAQMGSLLGMSLDMIYDRAVSLGFSRDKKTFYNHYDRLAEQVYKTAPLTQDIDMLGKKLIEMDFKLGLVSASRSHWIESVISRLTFKEHFSSIISVNDRPDLLPKPHPGGYLAAIQELGASPETTVILEDSNTGIQAGKAAGATVIGFKQNLLPGYQQTGADKYAENIEEVIEIVKGF